MKLTKLTPDQIRSLRKKTGMTQAECATKCGISLRSWHGFEAGLPMRDIYIKMMGWKK